MRELTPGISRFALRPGYSCHAHVIVNPFNSVHMKFKPGMIR